MKFVIQLAFVMIALFATVPASAAIVFPLDINITGTYLFDTGGSFIGTNVNQTGSIYSTVGGVQGTPTTYSGVTVSGANPITSTLTHHGGGTAANGDGFGGTAEITANTNGDITSFRADTDLDDSNPNATPMTITNNSITSTFEFVIAFAFDHEVEASGPDAGIRSDFDLELNGTRIFNSELISDTVVGNFENGSATGGFGGLLEDDGVFQFTFALAPGASAEIGLDYTLEGPSTGFDDGSVEGSAEYFLSVANVSAVPEPTSTGMIGCALFACMVRSRSRRNPRRTE